MDCSLTRIARLLSGRYNYVQRNRTDALSVLGDIAKNQTCHRLADWQRILGHRLPNISKHVAIARHSFSLAASFFGFVGYTLILTVILGNVDYGSASYTYHKVISVLELFLMSYNMIHRSLCLMPFIDSNFANSTAYNINSRYVHNLRNTLSKCIDLVTLWVTIDRLIAIYWPARWRTFNVHKTAVKLCVCSLIAAFIMDMPEYFVWINDRNFYKSQIYECIRYSKTVYGLLLAALTFVLTVFIVRGFLKLKRSHRNRCNQREVALSHLKQHHSQSQVGASGVDGEVLSNEISKQPLNRRPSATDGPDAKTKKKKKQSEWRSLTNLCYLLLALVIPYLINQICNLFSHVAVFNFKRLQASFGEESFSDFMEKLPFAFKFKWYAIFFQDITNDLYHTSNFYLYVALSDKFRNSFLVKFGLAEPRSRAATL